MLDEFYEYTDDFNNHDQWLDDYNQKIQQLNDEHREKVKQLHDQYYQKAGVINND